MRLRPSAHYLDSRGEAYVRARQEDPCFAGYRLDLRFFLPYLRESDVVLDFGCGNGGLLRLVRDHVARADGLEVNPAARQIACTSGSAVYSSVEELPGAPVYDAIVTNHVLEHVRDVCGTLEVLREKLKRGGLLVAKLPIDDWRAAHQQTWSPGDRDHHLATWTPRLFANVLFEAGFDVRECRVVTSAWHPRLFRLYRFGLGKPVAFATAVILKRRQLFAVGVA